MADERQTELSITQWMHQAKHQDPEAQNKLWLRYYERLIRIARARLPTGNRRVADEEDVVIQAFGTFFRALELGRMDEHADRDDLWRVLVAITDSKARDLARHERRQKRGGGQVRGHSVMRLDDSSRVDGFDQLPDPTPEFAGEFSLACEHLLRDLKPEHRQIAIWKLEGRTNKEIAEQLGCVEEAVRRKVKLIRAACERQLD